MTNPRARRDSRSSLTIELRPDDLDALAEWAFEEYRRPQDQASYIIAQALKQREPTTSSREPMTPGEVREAREARGLTQIELAELAGVSHRTLQAYEVGERKISRTSLRLIRVALKGISVDGHRNLDGEDGC